MSLRAQSQTSNALTAPVEVEYQSASGVRATAAQKKGKGQRRYVRLFGEDVAGEKAGEGLPQATNYRLCVFV